MNKYTIWLFIFTLFSSSLASAALFINDPLDRYDEYYVVRNHNVISSINSANVMFTYAGTYVLSTYNSFGFKKEVSLEVRCRRYENAKPSYNFKDVVSVPVDSTDECSKLIMKMNDLIDQGLHPRILLNPSNGKFLVFRE